MRFPDLSQPKNFIALSSLFLLLAIVPLTTLLLTKPTNLVKRAAEEEYQVQIVSPKENERVKGNVILKASAGASPSQAAFQALVESHASVTVSPAKSALEIEEVVRVNVEVDNLEDLFYYGVRMKFNPGILAVQDSDPQLEGVQVILGDVFANRRLLIEPNLADNKTGEINLRVALAERLPGVSGGGTLLALDFKGLKEGRSNLEVVSIDLITINGRNLRAQVENSSLEVGGPTEPKPGTAKVRFEPETARVNLNSFVEISSLEEEELTDIVFYEVEAEFNPTVVQVEDADPQTEGTQILPGDIFFGRERILKNIVDNQKGKITYAAATLINEKCTTCKGSLFTAKFKGIYIATTALRFTKIEIKDRLFKPLKADYQNGEITVDPSPPPPPRVWPDGRTKVWVEPLSQKGRIGETFKVEIKMNDYITDLSAYKIIMHYDSERLEIMDTDGKAENGVQLEAGTIFANRPSRVQSLVSQDTGSISYEAALESGGVSQGGSLFKASFKALGKGEARLDIVETLVILTRSDGQGGTSPSEDGVINIGDSSRQSLALLHPEAMTFYKDSLSGYFSVYFLEVMDLAKYRLGLSYSPDYLEVVDEDEATAGIQVSGGEILGAGYEVVVNQAAGGLIEFLAQKSPQVSGFTGSGLALKFRFQGRAVGESELLLERVEVYDSQGERREVNLGGSAKVVVEPSLPVEPVLVRVDPPLASLGIGESVDLRVLVEVVDKKVSQKISNFFIALKYSPKILAPEDLMPEGEGYLKLGNIFGGKNSRLVKNAADLKEGILSLEAERVGEALQGSGDSPLSLVEMRFKAQDEGASEIEILKIHLLDKTGEIIPLKSLGGKIIVSPTKEKKATIKVEPPSKELTVGESFEMKLNIESVKNLANYFVVVSYDPKVVAVQDAEPGNEGVNVKRGNIFEVKPIFNEVFNSIGLIIYLSDQESTSKMAGSLFEATFKGVGVGETGINITQVSLYDSKSERMPWDGFGGKVYVSAPEPPPTIKVQFWLDDVEIGDPVAAGESGYFEAAWLSEEVADGEHDLLSTLEVEGELEASSEVVKIFVSNTYTDEPVTLILGPKPDKVGWVSSLDNERNHFGDDDLYTGYYGQANYHGAVQFDLSEIPADSLIKEARVILTGQTRGYLFGEKGEWRLQSLAESVDENWSGHGYQKIAEAASLGTIEPVLGHEDLQRGQENVFTFSQAQVSSLQEKIKSGGNFKVSFRLDGPLSGSGPQVSPLEGLEIPSQLFSWDSGYGTGGLQKPPLLEITYFGKLPQQPE